MAIAGRTTLDLIEWAYDWAQRAVEASDYAADGFVERFKLFCGDDSPDSATVSTIDDNDASGAISQGDTVRVLHRDCAGANSELSLQIGAVDVLDRKLSSLSATVTVSVSAADDSDAASIAGYTGSFSLHYTRDGEAAALTLTEMEASKVSGSMTERLVSARLEEAIRDPEYSVEFSGRLESDEVGGSFNFETATPFGGDRGGFPTGGELVLTAESSAARVIPSSNADLDEHADYQVDATGTGQYSDAVSVRWRDWISGSLFSWYPLIRELSTEPRRPDATQSLRAIYRLYNPRGGSLSLTYEWLVNGSELAGRTDGLLPPGHASKGDVVDLRLTASVADMTMTRTFRVTIRNKPPDLQVALSPQDPETTDDIALGYSVSDTDGDEIETNIQWSINGNPVSDIDSATLPADRHRKNDVIGVRVTANDGEDETSRELQVTVQDALPVVSVSGAPDAVDYGSRVDFTASVTDADGDDLASFRFALDHGPPEMTVDPVTGRVGWDVRMPMFDREMNVGWQIGSSTGPAETASAVLRVVDPDRQYPFMVSGFSGRPLRIADLDGDGDEEMLELNDSGHAYLLEWDGQDYRQVWAHPFANEEEAGFSALTTGDIDGDGNHEIFLAARGPHVGDDTMIRLDGSDRRIVDSATVPRMAGSMDLEFADLNNDGSYEIVYLAEAFPHFHSRIVVLSAADLSVVWESAPDYLGSFVELSNVDNDPALEIIVSGGHFFDGATHAHEWSHASALDAENASEATAARGLIARDVDGDGVDEFIGTLDRNDHYAVLDVYSFARQRIIGNAGPLPGSLLDGRVRSPIAADIDDDDIVEILGTSYPDFSVSAYRYEESTDSFVQVFHREANSEFASPLGVGDLDGDGDVEIVLGGRDEYFDGSPDGIGAFVVAAFNPEFEVEWTQPDAWDFRGGFAGGYPVMRDDGSASEPLFVLSGGRLDHGGYTPRAAFLSPLSGELSIGPRVDRGQPPNPFDVSPFDRWRVTGASIVDYDKDGSVEMFLSQLDDIGRLLVIDALQERVEWVLDPYNGIFVDSSDLNGDGFEDLLSTRGAYDIVNDATIWEPQLEFSDDRVEKVSGGDLNGDSVAEIVTVGSGILFLYSRASLEESFTRSEAPRNLRENTISVSDLVIEDTDGDGVGELLLLESAYRELRRYDSTFGLLSSFDTAYGTGHDEVDLIFPLPGGGGRSQILVSYLRETRDRTSRLVAYDASTGSRIWESPWLFGRILRNSVHYFEYEGEPRLAIGTSEALYVTR